MRRFVSWGNFATWKTWSFSASYIHKGSTCIFQGWFEGLPIGNRDSYGNSMGKGSHYWGFLKIPLNISTILKNKKTSKNEVLYSSSFSNWYSPPTICQIRVAKMATPVTMPAQSGLTWKDFLFWPTQATHLHWLMLLMKEILHQLIDTLSHCVQGCLTSQVVQDFSHQQHLPIQSYLPSEIHVQNYSSSAIFLIKKDWISKAVKRRKYIKDR